MLWKLDPFGPSLPPVFPLLAPHWVTPELRVPSDSVTRLSTLNPSSGAQALLPLPLSTWGCGEVISVAMILAAPARGTQAYTHPGCPGSNGQAPQCEAGEPIPNHGQQQGRPHRPDPRLQSPGGGRSPGFLPWSWPPASTPPAGQADGSPGLGQGQGWEAARASRGGGEGGAPLRPPPLTDGGDVRGVELVVGEAAQQAGLAHAGVPDQQQPEQHIVLLRHGWGRRGPEGCGRAAGSAPLGRCHRGARPPGDAAGCEEEAGPATAPASPARSGPGSAARRERGWEERARAAPARPFPCAAAAGVPGEGAGSARRSAATPRRGPGGGEAGALPGGSWNPAPSNPRVTDPRPRGKGADVPNAGVEVSSHPAHLYQTRLTGLLTSPQIPSRSWPC